MTVANPVPVQRYQLSNNIESATLELDETASIISYEEYYPYGETSYRAGRNASEVSQKRYRYTGKEKDEESGLYYHGARYYACWLGRWTASDPAGTIDGLNLYIYCRGNPVKLLDPSGTVANSANVIDDLPGAKIRSGEVATVGGVREHAQGAFEENDVDAQKTSNSNNKEKSKESAFNFDEVGQSVLSHIRTIGYKLLQDMLNALDTASPGTLKSAPITEPTPDNPDRNPYFDMATNTIYYNPDRSDIIDQFIHEMVHFLQKIEGRYKTRPIPISLEVEAFQMQFESMEADNRTLNLEGNNKDIILKNYKLYQANKKNLRHYGAWLYKSIYIKQEVTTEDGTKEKKYINDYIK
ncbi:MAG: RHS repeat-associated core domain-containing protein [Fibrobacter sp.]|nr:RHS repeat-associated core domain-containing protein [Fibrobacter sp.]